MTTPIQSAAMRFSQLPSQQRFGKGRVLPALLLATAGVLTSAGETTAGDALGGKPPLKSPASSKPAVTPREDLQKKLDAANTRADIAEEHARNTRNAALVGTSGIALSLLLLAGAKALGRRKADVDT